MPEKKPRKRTVRKKVQPKTKKTVKRSKKIPQPELPLGPQTPQAAPAPKEEISTRPETAIPAQVPTEQTPETSAAQTAAPVKKPATRKRASVSPFKALLGVRPIPFFRLKDRIIAFVLFAVLCAVLQPLRTVNIPQGLVIAPESPVYYHDQFIKLRVTTKDGKMLAYLEKNPPKVYVTYAGQPVKTIGGLESAYMTYNPNGYWQGVFPCPWNAPRGKYEFRIADDNIKPYLIKTKPFEIASRKLPPLGKRLAVLTMEYAGSYASIKIPLPDGTKTDVRGIADWAKRLNMDAVWILVGKTTGNNGQIWNPIAYDAIRTLGRACHEKGIKLGVWEMSYLTHPEKQKWLTRYDWALDMKNGTPVPVRAISLLDKHRPDDIADLLIQFRDMPEVDMLGLDYIRNALGGYEMAEEFYKDMPWLNKPAGWDRMNHMQRVAAFARLKIPRRDMQLIDGWQWWRAHKVGEIVRHIKGRLGESKPLWAFTLGWEKGWQHGQDPVMMIDAGIDIDAIMLYEATNDQYASMMKEWNEYIKHGDTRVIVGNIVDWPLHQGGGLEEYKRRFNWAIRSIYKDGPADGIFVHDLSRLLWGRKGPASTAQWTEATRQVIANYLAAAAAYLKREGTLR